MSQRVSAVYKSVEILKPEWIFLVKLVLNDVEFSFNGQALSSFALLLGIFVQHHAMLDVLFSLLAFL